MTPPLDKTDPLVDPRYDFSGAKQDLIQLVLNRPYTRIWIWAAALSFGLLMVFMAAVTWAVVRGVGIWGIGIPVAWAFAIINLVWWIGIGHAGTFISAILLLVRQDWRNSINRFAEAMTLFAVASAGIFPILHLGRQWLFYWLIPYPNNFDLYPQYLSPLAWDVFAIGAYITVSFVFWYIGLIPDFAALRDKTDHPGWQKVYGVLALGWRNSARHWHRYERCYLLLAGLATPLVISVHTIISFDFSISLLPGWHSTIFPPYFVAGAIFSGFAMVLVLTIPLRRIYHLQGFITDRHLDNCAQLMLMSSLVVGYSYIMEFFFGWYSNDPHEWSIYLNRLQGPKRSLYGIMVLANIIIPQLLWKKSFRRQEILLLIVSLFVLVGMWFERYVIIVLSLERDFLTSSWGGYSPTLWDYATFLGSFGLFFFLLLLFVRFFPMIPLFEVQKLIYEGKGGEHGR